jgi:hypothetical protein
VSEVEVGKGSREPREKGWLMKQFVRRLGSDDRHLKLMARADQMKFESRIAMEGVAPGTFGDSPMGATKTRSSGFRRRISKAKGLAERSEHEGLS